MLWGDFVYEELKELLKIEEIKQEINNKEKELSLLKEEFEKRKRLIEDNSTFDIDKILFYITKLVSYILKNDYHVELIKTIKKGNVVNYMYILSNLNKTISISDNEFYDELENENIIIIATGTCRKTPTKMSLSKKKKNDYVYLHNCIPENIAMHIYSFLELIIKNKIFNNIILYKDSFDEYIKGLESKKLCIKK